MIIYQSIIILVIHRKREEEIIKIIIRSPEIVIFSHFLALNKTVL